jgi:hypothetical protein
MSDTRITVDAFYDWSKDRKDLCDRLEKCDNFLALDLDEVGVPQEDRNSSTDVR